MDHGFKCGRNSDQDQEGDLADIARSAELPPRIAYDGIFELSPSYRQLRHANAGVVGLELLAKPPAARSLTGISVEVRGGRRRSGSA